MSNFRVDKKRWAKFTSYEQMGNIGSEVGRALRAKRNGDTKLAYQAMVRALELFSATMDLLIRQKSPRAKEVLRSRDQFLTVLTNPDATPQDMASLETYFMRFALTARANR